MLQSFAELSQPQLGGPRLARLRAAIASAGLSGFLVPRADAHQGEYVADCDARLTWLTGFTGSAGFAAILPEIAGVFVDGRYRVQVRAQVDGSAFTPVDWPATGLADWLKSHAPTGATVGFDPWLHTVGEVERLRKDLTGSGVTLVEHENLVDAIWEDRPGRPTAPAFAHPLALAGRRAARKRAEAAETLREAGETAAVLTLPDSIAWLLNIRGGDLPRMPVLQAFALLHADGGVDLFTDPGKTEAIVDHLGPEVRVAARDDFAPALRRLAGRVRIDRTSAPMAVKLALTEAGAGTSFARDPCVLPKACKTQAEIAGASAAHLRDGTAMVEFLAWFDSACAAGKTLTEIALVRRLESCRAATGRLRDIAFDTIAGSGPNAAIVHYRVTEATDRRLGPGELVLIDSGGQYADGTTDITRTVPTGPVPEDQRHAYTRVLKGLIAISRARFPDGVAGRDLDALARAALWRAGQDYDHGTGHGVGSYLSVHEGPQRLARSSTEPLLPGMILSNEPGYYRDGGFGIRLENLVLVEQAAPIAGGDDRPMRSFRTLTQVPFDRRLIEAAMLDLEERAWLDHYHDGVNRRLSPLLSPAARDWLAAATQPITPGAADGVVAAAPAPAPTR